MDDVDIVETINRGVLIEDDVVCQLVGEQLKQIGFDKSILLDGFPRTVPQAKWLLEHADEINKHIKLVIYLTVDDEVAAMRLDNRGRVDDSEAARVQRDQEATRIVPTLEYLKQAGVGVLEIKANGSVEEIFEEVSAAIKEKL